MTPIWDPKILALMFPTRKITPINLKYQFDVNPGETFRENKWKPEFWPMFGPQITPNWTLGPITQSSSHELFKFPVNPVENFQENSRKQKFYLSGSKRDKKCGPNDRTPNMRLNQISWLHREKMPSKYLFCRIKIIYWNLKGKNNSTSVGVISMCTLKLQEVFASRLIFIEKNLGFSVWTNCWNVIDFKQGFTKRHDIRNLGHSCLFIQLNL